MGGSGSQCSDIKKQTFSEGYIMESCILLNIQDLNRFVKKKIGEFVFYQLKE
jgi:hypothetical protein